MSNTSVTTHETPRKHLTLACHRLPYGLEHPRQYLDLYYLSSQVRSNQGDPPPPKYLIFFIHGGAWRSNAPDQFAEQACILFDKVLCPEEVAVVIPAYQLSLAPEWPQHPAHLDDLTKALDYISTHDILSDSPTQLHLMGHSCGATLAAQLVLSNRIPQSSPLQLRSVVGIEGIYDIPMLVRDFPSYAEHFINNAFGHDMAGWADASPTHLALSSSSSFSSLSPLTWVLIHSMEDELLNLAQTTAFASAISQAFPSHTLIVDSTSLTGEHDPCLSNPIWATVALSHIKL
ncbi:MAG: Alpha/Beta hydrolase protein [Piptocephalis tieghemiana]|nr:MAG: Alpha/Beta hydrolase protein [Piptocephalis tieghemiana]